jgi:hypothetical protein
LAADDYRVVAPPLDVLARVWPVVEPILQRATDRVTGYEPIDLLRQTLLGRMSMWLVLDPAGNIVAAAVSELREYPRSRVLEVPFIAGSGLKRWHKRLLATLDDHARALGCIDIMGFDRKGWAAFGFEVCGVALVRHVPLAAAAKANGHG